MKFKFAAQLYSVREEFAKDCEGTIKELKNIGFKAVQLDGMRGNEPLEVARILKKYNMEVAGMHIKHDRFLNDIDGIVEESYLFGCKDIYCKYIDNEYQNIDGYKLTKKVLLEAVKKLSNLGFRVGLHNPEYDFNNTIDGRYVMDYITDPEYGISIYPEVDTYWISVAGHNPVEYIKRYSGRMPIIHFKDYKHGFNSNDMDNNLREIGKGDIDFLSILKWGNKNGIEYYCIEQDRSQIGILNSLKISLDYITKLSEQL